MSAELCSIVIILTQCVPCIDRGNLNSRLATNCTSIVSFRSPMVVSPDISLLNYAVYSHHIDTRLNPTQHAINKPRQHAQVEMQKVQTTQQWRDSTFMQRPTDRRQPARSATYTTLAVGDTHLERVNVVSDDDQLRLLLLDQRRHRVDAGPHHEGALRRHVVLALDALLSALDEARLASARRLRPVLVHQTEQLARCNRTTAVRPGLTVRQNSR